MHTACTVVHSTSNSGTPYTGTAPYAFDPEQYLNANYAYRRHADLENSSSYTWRMYNYELLALNMPRINFNGTIGLVIYQAGLMDKFALTDFTGQSFTGVVSHVSGEVSLTSKPAFTL